MKRETEISGHQVAAARLLTGVGRAELAAAAGISVALLRKLEASGSATFPDEDKVTAVRKALEDFGVIFLFEEKGIGAGVRLKFTRLDTEQIGELENEGGFVREDDVP